MNDVRKNNDEVRKKIAVVQKNGYSINPVFYSAIKNGKHCDADMLIYRRVSEVASEVSKNDSFAGKLGCIACGAFALLSLTIFIIELLCGNLTSMATIIIGGIGVVLVFVIIKLKEQYKTRMRIYDEVSRAIEKRNLILMNYTIEGKLWYDGEDCSNSYYFVFDGFVLDIDGATYRNALTGGTLTAAVIQTESSEYFYVVGCKHSENL